MLPLFALALFTSATLLFWVQPLFAKMILPLLGGTPAVWNTSMVFFQAVLLGGYLYAHASTRRLGERKQVILHLGLLLVALPCIPLAVRVPGPPPASSNPVLWLLAVLFLSVGLPAFVISGTAPLLQKWFSRTGHRHAGDPYFLYGASNLGSMAALVGYPVLAEPLLRIAQQGRAWAVGYLLLLVLIGSCALLLWRSGHGGGNQEGAETATAVPVTPDPSWIERGRWVILSLVPSSLLLGVTSHITNDVAAVPLLWIIPLVLYLLTFVIVFARRPLLRHSWMTAAQPFSLAVLAAVVGTGSSESGVAFAAHLLAFFVTAMVCHGELVARRPPADHLTGFYLWISVGGVLGGIFNSLVAPLVFPTVIEYWIALVAACLLRPGAWDGGGHRFRILLDLLLPAALGIGLAGALLLYERSQPEFMADLLVRTGLILAAGCACWMFRGRPLRFGAGFAAILVAGTMTVTFPFTTIHRERNFFGVLTVLTDPGKRFHLIRHGKVFHGAQSLDRLGRREPLTYFSRPGPLGNLFETLSRRLEGRRIGVIGLGAGSVAAYGTVGQEITFYEIDPAVERVARDPRYFSFLADSEASVKVVIGDGRLKLAEAPDRSFALVIVDAFSSDSIPIHIITREALQLYLSKLAPDGVLAFNITNNYLDLVPAVHALAADAGLLCLVKRDTVMPGEHQALFRTASTWAVMTRPPNMETLRPLGAFPPWYEMEGVPDRRVWTDDYSNILSALTWLPGR
jgi:hypothetical protein